MSSRYGSQLHQRDARSQLFDNSGYGYPGDGRASPRIASAYRPAAPNSRGQYSASVLEELESQNDAQVEGLSAKVKMLKDITEAIGEEVRSSSSLVASMNDSFDNTRVRLRGTMNNMMRMAKTTGVGWRAWLLFIMAVAVIFWYVWLF
ncbi:protein transport protein bet1 [Maublancomyces gigas]|uniref:Protein transport protein bet1 n=1 Tax=Discina gigas TaxID=1032678 RepID=A0ABR3GP31_9PEZI